MSLLDDFKTEAKREEIKTEFRGHEVVIKTIIGLEAAPYYKWLADNIPAESRLIADVRAATIAASIFTLDGERMPVELIPAIRNQWSPKEVEFLYKKCIQVGNNITDDEAQEKKE